MKINLPLDFIKAVTSKLNLKRRELHSQKELLVKEDPYMQPGRTEGNSEDMDEAILEDAEKNLTDIQLTALEKMQIQVNKALGALKIGKYGICEICGRRIDKARLKMYPQATTCVECERDKEQVLETAK